MLAINVIPLNIPKKTPSMSELAKDSIDDWSDRLEAVANHQDRAAFSALFNHFGPLIKAFALSADLQRQGSHLPDELVQNVMLSVWRKATTFDRKKAAASTWIFTIARNQRIDMLRRLKKHQKDVSVDAIWDLENDTELFNEARSKQIRLEVTKRLQELPVDQRQVVAKVFMEDKSHQDAAHEMNLPLGTVKSRVRLAMKKLKMSLEGTEL